MARLTVYKDNDLDSTTVSNLFIDEYMGNANDAQLKVYLYLLRMMNAHLATSVSDIADKFNHTEKDVIRALKYWEKLHLLDLDYDSNKTLIGIHMHDLCDAGAAFQRRQSEHCSFVPVPALQNETFTLPVSPKESTTVMKNSTSVDLESDHLRFEKPSYSADQLRQFKQRQETAQLIFIAESYLGKPLTPSEMKTLLFFTDILKFSDDMIDYLIQYCVEKGKKDFKYIEKVALNWAEAGITTPKQAQQNSYLYEKNVYLILRELGKTSTPTPKEAAYVTKWIQEFGFDHDIISEACERTVMATDKNRLEYADRILASWHTQNVHHKSDITKIDEMYKQRKKLTASSRQNPNHFNSFAQNSYDFDALEKELLSN